MSATPSYKLIYFNARGRAELSRLLFAHAGVEYEDFRLESTDWPTYKPNTPYGSVPVLEINKQLNLAQSKTIARYLATEFGLAGKSPVDQAKANMIVEVVHDDIIPKVAEIYHENDYSRKNMLMEKHGNVIKGLFGKLQEQLKENGGNFFVGDALTWADFAVADGLDRLRVFLTDKDEFPLLKDHQKTVYALPKVAEWLKNRPLTWG